MRLPSLLLVTVLTAAALGRAAENPAAAPGTNPPTSSTVTLGTLALQAETHVDRQGVFLSQLATASDGAPLPALRLLPAPPVGSPLVLTRTRIQHLLAQPEFGLTVSNWSGPDRVLITRRVRPLGESEVKELLTAALQQGYVQDRGELELRFGRPWTPVQIPDEPFTIRPLDLPSSGLSPLLLVRFELLNGTESAGSWQAVLQARVWREIWVARFALRRGQELQESDLTRERRDVLTLREPLADPPFGGATLQLTEAVTVGAPIYQRHLRLQPVMRRGQTAEAILADGAMNLVLKVEVLEDGAPGQVIRIRTQFPAESYAERSKMKKPLSWASSPPFLVLAHASLPTLTLTLVLAPSPAPADSLWNDDVARPMLSDKRASGVGDLLTVVVQENNSASKDKNTKTTKSAGMDASISSFFYSPGASGLLTKGGQLPALKYNSKNDFEGGGAINNSERIIARIGVRVIDVLPNRNLVIEGSRETAFSGEQQTIVLRGVIRPEDISTANSVFSYNISDATIKFVSKGTLSDSQKKGWFTKIWDKLSPF